MILVYNWSQGLYYILDRGLQRTATQVHTPWTQRYVEHTQEKPRGAVPKSKSPQGPDLPRAIMVHIVVKIPGP